MIAILGGLTGALLWSISTVTSARASRLVGSVSVVAWAMLVGLLLDLPFLVLAGPPPALEPLGLLYLVVSGLSNIVGLVFVVRALQLGKIGLVTAICSTEGAVGAVLAILAGESVTPWVALTLLWIAGGIVFVALVAEEASPHEAEAEAGALAAVLPAPRRHVDPAHARRSIVLAALAALVFGAGLFTTGQAGRLLPIAWAVLPARLFGVLLLLIPLVATRRLRLTREAVPLVTLIGFCELAGTAAYATGAQESVAIAAVLVSQFAALAAVIAFFVYGERLTLRQRSGVVAIALGVALLAALRA